MSSCAGGNVADIAADVLGSAAVEMLDVDDELMLIQFAL